MNRRTIVQRALYALLPFLGIAVVYVLPMLGLHFADDHGWYVASAATIVPFLRATPLERISEVLSYHEHDGRRCAHVVLEELDGAPELEVCIWADELHIDADRTDEDLDVEVDRAGLARPDCTCGHRAEFHGELFGCWYTGGGALECTCSQYLAAPSDEASVDDFHLHTVAATTAGPRLQIALHRLKYADGVEHEVSFDPPPGCHDFPTVAADDIGAVIDALDELRRAWIADGGAA